MCTNKNLTCLCLICSFDKFIFPLKCTVYNISLSAKILQKQKDKTKNKTK